MHFSSSEAKSQPHDLQITAKKYFTITAEIFARSLANFYCQYADRRMNLLCGASTSKSAQFDNLLS